MILGVTGFQERFCGRFTGLIGLALKILTGNGLRKAWQGEHCLPVMLRFVYRLLRLERTWPTAFATSFGIVFGGFIPCGMRGINCLKALDGMQLREQ